MKRFFIVNLKDYYNHKMVYGQLPKENAEQEFGLDNTCILKSDVKLEEHDTLDDIEFRFSFGHFDNVVCDRQKIEVNDIATKLHLIGFSYWGDTTEYFKIVYKDLSEEIIWVPFVDWSHKSYNTLRNFGWNEKNISIARTVITSGAVINLAYFHHVTCEIAKRKIIKEIVLPNNIFTHIFAMTLEDESCSIKK